MAELLGEVGDHDSSGRSEAEADVAQWHISSWSMWYSNNDDGGGGGGALVGPAVGALWSGATNLDVPGCWVIHPGVGGCTSMGLGGALGHILVGTIGSGLEMPYTEPYTWSHLSWIKGGHLEPILWAYLRPCIRALVILD